MVSENGELPTFRGAAPSKARVSGLAVISTLQPLEIDSEQARLAAFEQLYRTHGGRLKSIAWHMLGNRQDAEDAVQETFVKAYRAVAGFQGQSEIGTWLCRILINLCHDVNRRRGREADPEEAALEERAAPNRQLALKVALEAALRRLHPKHRMVFLLFEAEGMRHAEIAAAMDIPEGTSKAWLSEAKKELKQMLTGGGE